MITLAFSLYDSKAQMYSVPFFMPSVGQALRACIDLGGDLNTTVGRHPTDFTVFQIGTFDDARGAMESHTPINLGLVHSFLPSPAPVLPNIFDGEAR